MMPIVVTQKSRLHYLLGPFEEEAEGLAAATSPRFCDLRRYPVAALPSQGGVGSTCGRRQSETKPKFWKKKKRLEK